MHRNSRRCEPPWASIKALLLKEQYVHSSSPAAQNTGSQPKAVGTCVLSRSQVVCLSLPVGKLWTKALRSQFICFLLKAHWNEAYKRRQSIRNPLLITQGWGAASLTSGGWCECRHLEVGGGGLRAVWKHVFPQMMYMCSVVSDSLQHHGLEPAGLCPWDSPGKNTGVSCHFPPPFFPQEGV